MHIKFENKNRYGTSVVLLLDVCFFLLGSASGWCVLVLFFFIIIVCSDDDAVDSKQNQNVALAGVYECASVFFSFSCVAKTLFSIYFHSFCSMEEERMGAFSVCTNLNHAHISNSFMDPLLIPAVQFLSSNRCFA